MSKARNQSTGGSRMRTIYTVWWNKEPEVISKKTGKPVRDFFQTLDIHAAERVAEARRQAGKQGVEITERVE